MKVDDAVVCRHELGRHGQTEPGPIGLSGHERIEQPAADLRRDAGSVVLNPYFEGGRLALRSAGPGQMAEGRGDDHFSPVVLAQPRGFGGILHKVQEHLHQLILVALHRWQGRIVHGAERKPLAHAVGDQRPDPVQHPVDVDRPWHRAPGIGERLQPLHQPPDPVGLVDDQLGERRVVGRGIGLQELRRPPDPGERVLDLMSQGPTKIGRGLQGTRRRILVALPQGMQRHHHGPIHGQSRHGIDHQRWTTGQDQLDLAFPPPAAASHGPLHEISQGRTGGGQPEPGGPPR